MFRPPLFRLDALSVQAGAKAVADGKSAVAGVHRHGDRWKVVTLQGWGLPARYVASFGSQEEARLVATTYFPRLEAAAAAGGPSFEEELSAVKAELRVQVRLWIVP